MRYGFAFAKNDKKTVKMGDWFVKNAQKRG